jgi:hypothetical protein
MHNNKGWPEGLPSTAYVKARMEDGSDCYAYATEFDWKNDVDPIAAFIVIREDAQKIVVVRPNSSTFDA